VKSNDDYQYYYQQLPSDIIAYKKGKRRLTFGYASDLDVIIDWDEKVFQEIIDDYLTIDPFIRDVEIIDSMESFTRILSHYMIHGLGGEIDITSKEVCDVLDERFNTHFGLGGTCAQASTALGTIGIPSIVHITDRSRETCRLMDDLDIEVVDHGNRVPLKTIANDNDPVRHIILQYPKGAKLEIGGEEYETPVSNRMILDYDKIHKILPIDREFLDYCELHAQDLIAYSASGFNGIVDPFLMAEKGKQLSAHYKRVQTQNPNCIIYLESAHYLNPEVNDLVFKSLTTSVDLLGMNEEELVVYTRKHGMLINQEDLKSVMEGIELLLSEYPVKGVVLHSKDYAMYYGHKIEGVDFLKGLTLGNLLAGTRARIGRYGSYKDCCDTLNLPLSQLGSAFADQLSTMEVDRCVHIVPSRYMEQPKYTIGLGDTFVAGFMISFICAEFDQQGN